MSLWYGPRSDDIVLTKACQFGDIPQAAFAVGVLAVMVKGLWMVRQIPRAAGQRFLSYICCQN